MKVTTITPTTVTTTTATTAKKKREHDKIGFSCQQTYDVFIKGGVIALVIFSPLAFGSVHPWAYTIIELTVICLYLLWMVQSLGPHLRGGDMRWKLALTKTPLNLPLCLLIGICLFQLCPLPAWFIQAVSPSTYDLYAATIPNGSEIGARTLSIYPWGSAQELYKLLAYIGVFYLVIYHFRERQWLNRLIAAMVITGFIIAVIGVLQHFTTPKMIYGFRDASYASPFGPYINRNHFAGYMEMTIFVGIGLLLSQALKRRTRKGGWRRYLYRWEAKISQQALVGFFVVVMMVALALSLSRGGISSSLVALVFMGGMMSIRRRGSSLTILVVIFSLALFFLLWLGIGPGTERLINPKFLKIGGRPLLWVGVMNIIRDFFTFGTGLGTFINISPPYQTLKFAGIFDHAENDYLEYFADIGVIGGIIWWGALFWTARQVLTRWFERRRSYVVGLSLGCITGVVSLLFHSMVDFNLHIPANALVFFVLLAVGFNTVHLRGEGKLMEVIAAQKKREMPARWGRVMLFFLLCGFVILAGGIIRSYLAEKSVHDVRAKIKLHSQGTIPSWVDLDTLKHLRRAQGLAPGYATPHYLLGKAYEQMALAQRDEEGQRVFFNMAAQEYKAAIKLEPTSVWYHLGLGWVYLVLSERDHSMKASAKREFAIAARLAPNNPDIQDYITEITKSWTDATPL